MPHPGPTHVTIVPHGHHTPPDEATSGRRGSACETSRRSLEESLFESLDEVVQVDLEGQAHLSKLKDVESTFARFVLADEWLWSPEARGKTHLTEARLPPYLPEQRLRGRLVAGCRAWAHALDHRAR